MSEKEGNIIPFGMVYHCGQRNLARKSSVNQRFSREILR